MDVGPGQNLAMDDNGGEAWAAVMVVAVVYRKYRLRTVAGMAI